MLRSLTENDDGLVHDGRSHLWWDGNILAADLGVDLEEQVQHGRPLFHRLLHGLCAQDLRHNSNFCVGDALDIGIGKAVLSWDNEKN